VISASHNPFQDNGIKFFSPAGFKLPDELENEIEHLVVSTRSTRSARRPPRSARRSASTTRSALQRLRKNSFPRHLTLDGMTIAIDCATARLSRRAEVLEARRASSARRRPERREHQPRRRGAASRHLQTAVRAGAHVGIALDGDADRCILVDERGDVVDGDEILAILATELHARARSRATLVATVRATWGSHGAPRTEDRRRDDPSATATSSRRW
jgi:phosphoglucosamine mutase